MSFDSTISGGTRGLLIRVAGLAAAGFPVTLPMAAGCLLLNMTKGALEANELEHKNNQPSSSQEDNSQLGVG